MSLIALFAGVVRGRPLRNARKVVCSFGCLMDTDESRDCFIGDEHDDDDDEDDNDDDDEDDDADVMMMMMMMVNMTKPAT